MSASPQAGPTANGDATGSAAPAATARNARAQTAAQVATASPGATRPIVARKVVKKAPPPRSRDAPPSGDDAAAERPRSTATKRRGCGEIIAVGGSNATGNIFDDAARPASIGDLVAMPTAKGRVYGLVHSVRQGRRTDDNAIVDVRLMGEITKAGDAWRFSRGVSAFPNLGAPIHYATAEEQMAVYARPGKPYVTIGNIANETNATAYVLADELLGKHFAVVGSTGSGKSCAVAVILRAILEQYPKGHIVVLDPHSEYGRAFGDRAHRLDTNSLELPYWLMTFEETAAILTRRDTERGMVEAHILKDAIMLAKRQYLGNDDEDDGWLTVDTPSPYRLSDVAKNLETAMGSLNKPDGAAPYMSLLARIESVRRDQRYAFMFQALRMQDSMAEILADILRLPTGGKPVTLLDIAGVPSEIVDVVVSVLCRMVFEFALWSERGATPPVLFVCEEAHRYVPQDDSQAFAPSRIAISRIAKEGRKYGVSLCLVSQRPSELSTTALSQCNTIVALRVSNDRDRQYVGAALPDGSDWLVNSLPSLREGEAVVVGEGVSVPVRVRLARLAPEHQPESTTPKFSEAWLRDDADLDVVDETVHRWRRQIR